MSRATEQWKRFAICMRLALRIDTPARLRRWVLMLLFAVVMAALLGRETLALWLLVTWVFFAVEIYKGNLKP